MSDKCDRLVPPPMKTRKIKVKFKHTGSETPRIKDDDKGMVGLSIFCPWCGAEYDDYLETVTILGSFGDTDDKGVLRRCLDCWQWERPEEGKVMVEVLCR